MKSGHKICLILYTNKEKVLLLAAIASLMIGLVNTYISIIVLRGQTAFFL